MSSLKLKFKKMFEHSDHRPTRPVNKRQSTLNQSSLPQPPPDMITNKKRIDTSPESRLLNIKQVDEMTSIMNKKPNMESIDYHHHHHHAQTTPPPPPPPFSQFSTPPPPYENFMHTNEFKNNNNNNNRNPEDFQAYLPPPPNVNPVTIFEVTEIRRAQRFRNMPNEQY